MRSSLKEQENDDVAMKDVKTQIKDPSFVVIEHDVTKALLHPTKRYLRKEDIEKKGIVNVGYWIYEYNIEKYFSEQALMNDRRLNMKLVFDHDMCESPYEAHWIRLMDHTNDIIFSLVPFAEPPEQQ